MKKYICDVSTGPNIVGYYRFDVTVYAENDNQAETLAARKGQEQLAWFEPLKVLSIRRGA